MAVTEFLLEALGPSARLALPYVESMLEQGFTTTQIQEALPELMGGLRRTRLLELVRAIQDIQLTRPYLSSVRNDRLPDASRLARPVSGTLRRYSFRMRVTGTNPETGERAEGFVTISTSRLLSAGELKRRALAMIPTTLGEVGPGSFTGPIEEPEASIHSGTSTE